MLIFRNVYLFLLLKMHMITIKLYPSKKKKKNTHKRKKSIMKNADKNSLISHTRKTLLTFCINAYLQLFLEISISIYKISLYKTEIKFWLLGLSSFLKTFTLNGRNKLPFVDDDDTMEKSVCPPDGIRRWGLLESI